MDSKERSYLTRLATEGSLVPDGNCNVHAAMLLDLIGEVEKLKRQSTIDERLKEVEFRKRQIERILGFEVCERLREKSGFSSGDFY